MNPCHIMHTGELMYMQRNVCIKKKMNKPLHKTQGHILYGGERKIRFGSAADSEMEMSAFISWLSVPFNSDLRPPPSIYRQIVMSRRIRTEVKHFAACMAPNYIIVRVVELSKKLYVFMF